LEWFVILFLGSFLLLSPRLFSKIGWYNSNNLDGNEESWEKMTKNSISKKVLFVFRVTGFAFIVVSLTRLLSKIQ
jgi:hypothetical protein